MSESKKQLDPKAMSIADAARVLAASGSKHISADSLRADMEAGAPSNPDGTISVVQYTAWLVKEMAQRAD
ncbi:MAG: hypothetical protein CML07_08290 [Psychrobacter sp.]|nr:hypothetical protein [Psychrobacter sp.]